MLGIVTSGTGKGSYFIQLYSEIFEKKVGFRPFPGTLNIQIKKVPLLNNDKKITLQKQGYGDVDCYPVLIQKAYKGFLIRPHKTTHPENTLEIISSINLRKTLNLHDGEEIECGLA